MYNQVCVSFQLSGQLLMSMWGDLHVPLQLVDSVRFSTLVCVRVCEEDENVSVESGIK